MMGIFFLAIFVLLVIIIYFLITSIFEGTFRRKRYQEFIDMFFKEYEMRENIRKKYEHK